MSRDIPFRSPSDAFAATAARRPDAPFLLAPASAGLPYAPEGFRVSYGACATDVDRLRAEYAAAGYGRGARVALLLENRPVFFQHWLALNALGVSIVPINPDVRPDELSFQLELSQADLLVATSDRIHVTKDAALGRARLIDTDG
jgi:acyl-CoA synthetase (AMP-forming)/AMP-acid ligase II